VLGGDVLLRAEERRHLPVAMIDGVSRYRLPRPVGQQLFKRPLRRGGRPSRQAPRAEMPPHYGACVLVADLRVEELAPVRQDHLHQRGLVAHADAPDRLDDGVGPRLGQGVFDRIADPP